MEIFKAKASRSKVAAGSQRVCRALAMAMRKETEVTKGDTSREGGWTRWHLKGYRKYCPADWWWRIHYQLGRGKSYFRGWWPSNEWAPGHLSNNKRQGVYQKTLKKHGPPLLRRKSICVAQHQYSKTLIMVHSSGNWGIIYLIGSYITDVMRCLRGELQSALHGKFICQWGGRSTWPLHIHFARCDF